MKDSLMKEHLVNAKVIAVIGFSKDPSKTAYRIPKYLTHHYKVIPVNPTTDEIEGLKCYKSIKDVPEPIDIVDVFRPGPQCGKIMQEIVSLSVKPKLVWLQLRITNKEAQELAKDHNIDYVEDLCIYVERERLLD